MPIRIDKESQFRKSAAQKLDGASRLAATLLAALLAVTAPACAPLPVETANRAGRAGLDEQRLSAFEDALREIEDLRHLLKVSKAERESREREIQSMREAAKRRQEETEVIRRRAAYWEAETRATKDELLQMEERSLELVQQLQDSVSELGRAKRDIEELEAKLARPALLQSELRRENTSLKWRWNRLQEYLQLLQQEGAAGHSADTALEESVAAAGAGPVSAPPGTRDTSANRIVSTPLGAKRSEDRTMLSVAMEQPILLLVAVVVLVPVGLMAVAVLLGIAYLWSSRRRRHDDEVNRLRERVVELESGDASKPGLENIAAQLLAERQLLHGPLSGETAHSRGGGERGANRRDTKGARSTPTSKRPKTIESPENPESPEIEDSPESSRSPQATARSAAPAEHPAAEPQPAAAARLQDRAAGKEPPANVPPRVTLGSTALDSAGKTTESIPRMDAPAPHAAGSEHLATEQLPSMEDIEAKHSERTDLLPKLEPSDELAHTDALPALAGAADLEPTGQLPALHDPTNLSRTGIIGDHAESATRAGEATDVPRVETKSSEAETDAEAATADITETAERLASEEQRWKTGSDDSSVSGDSAADLGTESDSETEAFDPIEDKVSAGTQTDTSAETLVDKVDFNAGEELNQALEEGGEEIEADWAEEPEVTERTEQEKQSEEVEDDEGETGELDETEETGELEETGESDSRETDQLAPLQLDSGGDEGDGVEDDDEDDGVEDDDGGVEQYGAGGTEERSSAKRTEPPDAETQARDNDRLKSDLLNDVTNLVREELDDRVT